MREQSEVLRPQSDEASLVQLRGEVERVRANARNPTVINRMDIVDGILGGIELARLQADAGNVIKGFVELSKILGLNVPEVKKPQLTPSQARLRSKYEALSDEDLMSIAQGTNVIDAEVIEDGDTSE